MRNQQFLTYKKRSEAVFLSLVIGLFAYGIRIFTGSFFADPLVIALIMGIIIRTSFADKLDLKVGAILASRIFIPIGIIFYAIHNLNFAKISTVNTNIIGLLIVIVLVYYFVILFLGHLLKQKKNITYLTATGSAICGASAIAITSPSVEAEPDDISISLLAVTLVAFVALFIILPFFSIIFNLTGQRHALLSGSILQFTGFVKASIQHLPRISDSMSTEELISFGSSIKAVRYLGLLVAIPLFASLNKNKFYVPWFLWAFLGAGFLGTGVYVKNPNFYANSLIPVVTPIYILSWSMAMASIGLNADVKQLFSNNGMKAIIMAFAGFVSAMVVFFVGIHFLKI